MSKRLENIVCVFVCTVFAILAFLFIANNLSTFEPAIKSFFAFRSKPAKISFSTGTEIDKCFDASKGPLSWSVDLDKQVGTTNVDLIWSYELDGSESVIQRERLYIGNVRATTLSRNEWINTWELFWSTFFSTAMTSNMDYQNIENIKLKLRISKKDKIIAEGEIPFCFNEDEEKNIEYENNTHNRIGESFTSYKDPSTVSQYENDELDTEVKKKIINEEYLENKMEKIENDYMAVVKHYNKSLNDEQARFISRAILHYSTKYLIDPRLTVALIAVISKFNPDEASNDGKKGLGQLGPLLIEKYGVENAYDTNDNIRVTVEHVRHLFDIFSEENNAQDFVIAAYLTGEENTQVLRKTMKKKHVNDFVIDVKNLYAYLVRGETR